MSRFPIGFWNYVDIDKQDASCVPDWADAGMTLTMGPNFGRNDTKAMAAILDAAADKDIRVILCHRDFYAPVLKKDGEETYRKRFKDAVKTYGDHPAVFAFHVGDEPDTEAFPYYCGAYRIQKELAPHLSPFCNLLPWHHGCETRVGYDKWSDYLDAYATEAKPDFLCYDCYSQMNPDPENAGGYEMYFTNLREYQEAGARHGIPFWNTVLSVGHFRYRCPKEDDLRWQLNTSLAHGATGILYFFLYMREPHANYRVAPIDEHWERTETFEWLSRVNRTFLNWQARAVQKLTLKNVRHSGRSWGGVTEFDGSGLVSKAAGGNLVVSEFKHEDGSDYVMFVNNSQTESIMADIVVRGRVKLLRVDWEGKEGELVGGDGRACKMGEDSVALNPWLAPGQMGLYHVLERRS